MQYIVEQTLAEFPAWQGGEETLKVIREKGDCNRVENYIIECCDTPTDGFINDLLWFERDEIAQYLGYESWDDYEYGKDEEEEDEDEEEVNAEELIRNVRGF